MVGYAFAGTVSNCIVDTVTLSATNGTYNREGGIVAYQEGGSIKDNCFAIDVKTSSADDMRGELAGYTGSDANGYYYNSESALAGVGKIGDSSTGVITQVYKLTVPDGISITGSTITNGGACNTRRATRPLPSPTFRAALGTSTIRL